METANDVLTWLRPILELGWPALVTLGIALLWRYHLKQQEFMFKAYRELQAEYIQTLREVAGLRAALPQIAPLVRPPVSET